MEHKKYFHKLSDMKEYVQYHGVQEWKYESFSWGYELFVDWKKEEKYRELVDRYGHENAVLSSGKWFEIESNGKFAIEFEKGKFYIHDDKLYCLDITKLPPAERIIVIESYE